MTFFFSLFCSLSYLAANSCAMAALFYVFSVVEKMEKSDPALGIWLLCLCLCETLLQLFLRRERSERAVIYFIAVFFAVQLVLVFAIHGFFSGFFVTLIVIAMWLYSYFSCFELCTKKLTAEKLTKSFDLCCLVLMFFLFFCSAKGLALYTVLPLVFSLMFSVFALILIRSGDGRRIRAALLGGGLVLCFGAVAAAFAALASGGIKQLVNMFFAALRFLGRCVDALLRFLLSLVPEKHYDYELPEPAAAMPQGPAQDMSFELMDPQIIMLAVLITGFAVALGFVLYRIIRGKKAVGTVSFGGEKNIKRHRLGFAGIISRLISRLWQRVSFGILCLSKRSTAPGLLMEIEKRSRSQLHGRGESETCREFLTRALAVYPHAESALIELADNMDSVSFGGGVSLPAAEIVRLRNFIFSKEQ